MQLPRVLLTWSLWVYNLIILGQTEIERVQKMSNPQSRDRKDCNLKDKDTNTVDIYGVYHQLAPVVEKVSTSRLLRKMSLEQTIQSKGVHEEVHLEEGGNFRTPEGATLVAGQVKKSTDKDFSNIVKPFGNKGPYQQHQFRCF